MPATYPEFNIHTDASEVTAKFSEQIKGKVIAITGTSPNSIGAASVLAIAEHAPALIVLLSRTPEKAAQVIKQIPSGGPKTVFIQLTLSSQESVRNAAKEVAKVTDKIDVLINNAGECGWPTRKLGEDGIERTFATNHIGHFLLTNLLRPLLKKSSNPRVVNVSSGLHNLTPVRFEDWNFEGKPVTPELVAPAQPPPPIFSLEIDAEGYNANVAYSQSKSANLLFTQYLASHGVLSSAVCPGLVASALLRNSETLRELVSTTDKKTCEQGAATIMVAAFDPKFGSGKEPVYISNCQDVSGTAEVAPYAFNPEQADRLWKLSEEIVGQKFEL